MTDNPETVQHIEVLPETLPHGLLWQPSVREETTALMERLRTELDDEARRRIQESAVLTLGRCTPLHQPGSTTGLVLGQIQSGKTMSFTTLAARDTVKCCGWAGQTNASLLGQTPIMLGA